MAGFDIDSFKANFTNAARNYLFYVNIDFPTGMNANQAIYLVRSSTIPGKSVEKKELGWQGYKFPIGGSTTHNDWTVTFLMDPNASIYKAMIDWSNMVHNPQTNVHGMPSDYMRNINIQLLSPTGNTAIQTVNLIGAWPTEIANIDLSYDNTDVATFQCTFAYVRHEYISGGFSLSSLGL